MKQLTTADANYLTTLIESMQFEINRLKTTGYFSPSYILEKTEKVNKIVKSAK